MEALGFRAPNNPIPTPLSLSSKPFSSSFYVGLVAQHVVDLWILCVVAAVWQSNVVSIQQFAFPSELVYLPFEALPSSNSGL